MPVTGLDKYEALVRVPDFGGILSQEDYIINEASHYQEHFASQIVLRRLSADFHSVLGSGKTSQIFCHLYPRSRCNGSRLLIERD